jgi:hypothetical protein
LNVGTIDNRSFESTNLTIKRRHHKKRLPGSSRPSIQNRHQKSMSSAQLLFDGNVRIDRVRVGNFTMSERVDRALRSNALFVRLNAIVWMRRPFLSMILEVATYENVSKVCNFASRHVEPMGAVVTLDQKSLRSKNLLHCGSIIRTQMDIEISPIKFLYV